MAVVEFLYQLVCGIFGAEFIYKVQIKNYFICLFSHADSLPLAAGKIISVEIANAYIAQLNKPGVSFFNTVFIIFVRHYLNAVSHF